jgi:transposase
MSYAEIIFNKRYYKCDSCGCGFFETLGEFVSSRGVSIYLEFAILEAIKNLSFTYKMIASMYNVSDTFVCEVFDRHVLIPPLKLPYVLCIDEIYARRLTSTKYCCVLFDPMENKIIDILYSRRKDLLEPYFLENLRKKRA